MADIAVVEAVEARLKAGFTACPIFVENSFVGTPEAGGPWLLLDFPHSNARQRTIGAPDANRYREEGAFRVVLNLKRGTDTKEGRRWLKDIADLFRGKRFDGVRTYAPLSPSSDDRSEVAGYFKLEMAVPYDFSIVG